MSQPNGIREKFIETMQSTSLIDPYDWEKVADFFLSHFSTELNNLEERIKESIGEEEKLEMDYGDHPKDQFKHGANHERWKNKRGVLSLLSDLKNKYK